jgi:hypothetical protein
MVDEKKKKKMVRRVKKETERERGKSRPFELKQTETGETREPSGGLKITPKTLYLQYPPPPPKKNPHPTHTHNEEEYKKLPDFSQFSVFFSIPSREEKR